MCYNIVMVYKNINSFRVNLNKKLKTRNKKLNASYKLIWQLHIVLGYDMEQIVQMYAVDKGGE